MNLLPAEARRHDNPNRPRQPMAKVIEFLATFEPPPSKENS